MAQKWRSKQQLLLKEYFELRFARFFGLTCLGYRRSKEEGRKL